MGWWPSFILPLPLLLLSPALVRMEHSNIHHHHGLLSIFSVEEGNAGDNNKCASWGWGLRLDWNGTVWNRSIKFINASIGIVLAEGRWWWLFPIHLNHHHGRRAVWFFAATATTTTTTPMEPIIHNKYEEIVPGISIRGNLLSLEEQEKDKKEDWMKVAWVGGFSNLYWFNSASLLLFFSVVMLSLSAVDSIQQFNSDVKEIHTNQSKFTPRLLRSNWCCSFFSCCFWYYFSFGFCPFILHWHSRYAVW